MATSSASASSPRRSTISAAPSFYPRSRKSGGNGQCTHLTTTRLYSNEFRCGICLRPGSMGWVYRCSQDRELLLEEEMENGMEESFDKLRDLLPERKSPRRRSAGARLSKLSFLEEISNEDLKTYTTAQLNQILTQRAHLLDILSNPDYSDFASIPGTTFYTMPFVTRPLPPTPTNITIANATNPFQNPSNPHHITSPPPGFRHIPNKPWLPLRNGECQFKCCHTCRPTLQDRAFLSLNGIVNDDIPATAITGFGFHLLKQRPVALVKHVKNLGLRPNPPARDPSESPRPSPMPLLRRRPNILGLGILQQEEETTVPTSSTSTVTASPPPSTPTIRLVPRTITPLLPFALPLTPSPILPPTPIININGRRHTFNERSSSASYTIATLTPLPPPTPNELSMGAGVVPLTPMERDEEDGGFGSAPLVVGEGVAVTEEAVELHVPDVITQF